MIRSSTGCAPTRLPMIFPRGTGGVIARNFGHACNVLQIKQDELDQEIACRRNRTQQNWDSSVRGKIRFPATYKVRPRITPRPAGRAGGTSAETVSGSNYCHSCPCCKTSGSTLWRIDNNTLANDTVHRLPVDIGPNPFEFERVKSGQRLAGLHWQQLGPSLNI